MDRLQSQTLSGFWRIRSHKSGRHKLKKLTKITSIIALLALIAVFAGCGGGGGGSTSTTTLGLTTTEPTLTDKTGQTISIPVTVTGSGTATTASFNLHFNSGIFEPVSGVTVGGSSVAISTASTIVARYKWVNSQTIKVLYASSVGASSGSVLVSVPVKVKAETDSALALQSVLINK